MDSLTLTAERRTTLGKKTVALRRTEKLPAVMYGHGKPSVPLTVSQREFERVFAQAGESSLIDLKIGADAPVKVLVQDVQYHPVSDRILHADFHQVDMSERIETEIALKFTGKSAAVHELGGTLVTNLEGIKVECLPSDLVHEIVVDLSVLNTFEDQIRISDLQLPAGIVSLDKSDTVIAVVTPPRTEEELKALDSEVVESVESVESVEPKPEAEPAEGEAGADEGKKEE